MSGVEEHRRVAAAAARVIAPDAPADGRWCVITTRGGRVTAHRATYSEKHEAAAAARAQRKDEDGVARYVVYAPTRSTDLWVLGPAGANFGCFKRAAPSRRKGNP
jgi:hypothetical protein